MKLRTLIILLFAFSFSVIKAQSSETINLMPIGNFLKVVKTSGTQRLCRVRCSHLIRLEKLLTRIGARMKLRNGWKIRIGITKKLSLPPN